MDKFHSPTAAREFWSAHITELKIFLYQFY